VQERDGADWGSAAASFLSYADLSAFLSAGVDPRVLLLTGSWSTSGKITI